jgi:hypothetical protein
VATGPWYNETLVNQEVKNFGLYGIAVALANMNWESKSTEAQERGIQEPEPTKGE